MNELKEEQREKFKEIFEIFKNPSNEKINLDKIECVLQNLGIILNKDDYEKVVEGKILEWEGQEQEKIEELSFN